jgi:hypothetical protein
MQTADDIIRLLDLRPRPESGHFRETFRDPRFAEGGADLGGNLLPAAAWRALTLEPCGTPPKSGNSIGALLRDSA